MSAARSGFAVVMSVAGAAAAFAILAATPQRGALPPGPSPPPTHLTPGAGFILGRVIEAGGDTPVPAAAVTLTGAALGTALSAFTDGTPGGARAAAADAQGDFLFRDLPAGTYQLSATAAGFVRGAYGQGRPFQLSRTLDVVGNVDVGDSEKVSGVTITLWRLAGIIGTVTDDAGEPMVGVPVSVVHRVTDWGGTFIAEGESVTTDDRGMYHADVTPGDYVVGVLAPPITVPVSFVDAYQQALALPPVVGGVLESASSSNAPTTAAAGSRLGNLIVSTGSGRGAPPSLVAPASSAGPASLYTTTYYPSSPSATSATVLSLASGEERAGVNLQLARQPARRVSGHITGPGGVGANLGVRLVFQDPSTDRWMNPMFMADAPQTITDAKGDFAFLGVASGSYVLRVFKNAKAADPILWALQPVTVGDSDLSDLQVELRFGSRMSGHVAFDGSGPTPAGAALTRMTMTPRALPGSNGAYALQRPPGFVDANATFVLGQLVPGPYMLQIAGIPPGWALKSVTTQGHEVIDAAFDLGATDLDDMVVTLTDRVSHVSGAIRDADGKPVPTASVGVFPVDKAHWRRPGMASPRVRTASADRSARYRVDGMPAGEYFIVAVDHPVDFSDPSVLTGLLGAATHVSVTDGDTKTVDLRVVVVK